MCEMGHFWVRRKAKSTPLSTQDPETPESACSRIRIHVGDKDVKNIGMNEDDKAEIERIFPILQGYLRAPTGMTCGRSDRSNGDLAPVTIANARVWGICGKSSKGLVGLGRVLWVEMRPAVGVRNGSFLGAAKSKIHSTLDPRSGNPGKRLQPHQNPCG